MDQIELFEQEVIQNIKDSHDDVDFMNINQAWFEKSVIHKYPYSFSWMGIPIIQYPQDIIAMQELIFRIKPDLIIETGIAHGGSLVFYASMMEILGNNGRVIGIDIDFREHNRKRLEKHPMFKHISLIQGSSIAQETAETVYKKASVYERAIVILDSMHTHEHVLAELRAYSPLVKKEGYIVVFDTIIEDMPITFYQDRPWSVGNNPKTAVRAFIQENNAFTIDNSYESKLLLTTCPDGFLKRVE